MSPCLPARFNNFLPRPFLWLNAAQSLGALNDNLFKLVLVLVLLHAQGGDRAAAITAVGSAVFVAPFLVLTPVGGRLADCWSKSRVLRAMKLLEVAIMGLGAWALASRSEPALYTTLALMASQSALLCPAKYGILLELVPSGDLSRANSRLEAATYLAIIAGTAAAPPLFAALQSQPGWIGALCVAVALLGWGASRGVGVTPAVRGRGEDQGWFCTSRESLRSIRDDCNLRLAVLGGALFMAIAAGVQLNLIPYGMQVLGFSESLAASLFFPAAVGMGAGALLAGRLSRRNVELGLVPVGAVLMTLGSLALGLLPGTPWVAFGATAVFGLGGGLFVVPVHAAIQFLAPPEHRGEIIGVSGWLGWVGVLGASGVLFALSHVPGGSAAWLFGGLGVLLAALTLVSLWCLPDFTLRFAARLLVRTFYRLRIEGADHLPVSGGALIVANHASWVDALLLVATTQRRIRFVMLRDIYQQRGLHWLFRLMGVIPIAPDAAPRHIAASLQSARNALEQGYLVCIFAEGKITRDGRLQGFRPGFERILRGTGFPVIPAHLGGLWGSIFSYAEGEGFFKRPKRIPYPASVTFGAPLASAATADEVRQVVEELESLTYQGENAVGDTLPKRLIWSCRKHWRQQALADTTGRSVTYGELLSCTVALREALTAGTQPGANIGVLVPPGVGGALANLAVTLSGRVPVNLNFTASPLAFAHALATARIERVIASRALVERLNPDLRLPGVVWIEDAVARLGWWDRAAAYAVARWLPRRLVLGASRHARPGDVAAVLFSSGSTGLPKGVLLSHRNLLSNVDAVAQAVQVAPKDGLCAALPLFHALGLTATLWLPVLHGFRAAYHTNPLEGDRVAAAVRETGATILLATPTFLLAYLRRAKPEDFQSLRLVMTGAEPLNPRLAARFEEKFGLRPLEGYGATELSPVATFNLPPWRVAGATTARAREGSVGRPLPGVRVRVVCPATADALPAGEQGVLQFSGHNVFLGYLGGEDGARRDGHWYDTGDLGRVDADGFVWVTGRLARFSKIGGEMVPHGAVEEALHAALGAEEPVAAVVGVPDERRGERLVVFYVEGKATGARLREALRHGSLPNLWKPAPESLIAVAELPVLGSGKLDVHSLRQMAVAKAAA